MASSKHSRPSRLFVAIVVIAALYFAKVVFVPLALALLFSLFLAPIVSFLEWLKFPRILAIFLTVIVVLGATGLLGWQTSQQFVNLTQQLPSYKMTLVDKIHSLVGSRNQTLSNASNTVQELAKEVVAVTPGSSLANDAKKSNTPPGSSPSKPMAVQIVSPANPLESVQNLLGPVLTAGVITIFTIFILMGREDLRDRFIRLAAGRRLNVMTQALDDATSRINRYLLLQLSVNVGYGALIAVALDVIGIPNAALWGLSAGILRFLPYVGPPLAALMPILLSLATFNGWGHALATMAVFFTLEVAVSNFLEPYLYGNHVGLSPLAILVAAIFWTLIWGLPGLLLSTPLTVCLVVMGRYIPSLAFLSILLGDEPVLPPHVQFYQRLLANDQNEARQILEEYLKEKPLEELFSSVIIPALSLAEEDRHRDVLDQETQNFIYQSTREITEDLGDNPAESPGEDNADSRAELSINPSQEADHVDVLCIPARDDADDVVAMLLARLLVRQGQSARSIPIGTTSEMLSEVADIHPGLVCISALPPFAISHAGALYTKLRAQQPKLQIMVCLWHFDGDMQAAANRLNLSKGHALFTTLQEALHHTSSLFPKKVLVGNKP